MIVVGGEALVDLVPIGSDGRDPTFAARPGGGPFTVAVSAARLGAEVAMLTRLSTDGFGDTLLARLRAAGVRTDLLQRGPEPTTLAVATLTADGSADYSFHVQGAADRMVTEPAALPAGTTAVSLGSLGMVLEPGASAYTALLHRAHADGLFVVLDPNIRAGLIDDPDGYRARFRSWLRSVDVLKVSVDDACWLAPGVDPLAAARDWLALGPAAVLLTLGADGIAVLTTQAQVRVPPVPVVVADTVGAGDTAHGALLHGLDRLGALDATAVRALDTGTWRALLTDCAAAAALTCTKVGAQPPDAAELAAFTAR